MGTVVVQFFFGTFWPVIGNVRFSSDYKSITLVKSFKEYISITKCSKFNGSSIKLYADNFLYSQHLLAYHCIDIVRRN